MTKMILFVKYLLFTTVGALFVLVAVTTFSDNDNRGSLFGVNFYHVLTGSMEPNYKIGDMAIGIDIEASEVQVNDVITYFAENSPELVTHRVTNVVKENGNIAFETKGDANNAVDSILVTEDRLESKVVFSIPYLGSISSFLGTWQGFLLLVCAPVLLVLIDETVTRFRRQKKREKVPA
ncbi:signal peptidase I [Salipaludibacillus daqingensis]|uniref:signal peptidase I n=1 Tax=Salipaludibacillus daqingensis TaxID=3041001 RepID=UPI002473D2C9|nr:signal peptidase I [Salipaludibacillus daqingensis]